MEKVLKKLERGTNAKLISKSVRKQHKNCIKVRRKYATDKKEKLVFLEKTPRKNKTILNQVYKEYIKKLQF